MFYKHIRLQSSCVFMGVQTQPGKHNHTHPHSPNTHPTHNYMHTPPHTHPTHTPHILHCSRDGDFFTICVRPKWTSPDLQTDFGHGPGETQRWDTPKEHIIQVNFLFLPSSGVIQNHRPPGSAVLTHVLFWLKNTGVRGRNGPHHRQHRAGALLMKVLDCARDWPDCHLTRKTLVCAFWISNRIMQC